MLEKKIKIVNSLGLHARAAAQLVRLAGQFNSKIQISRTDNGISADAKSILSVLSLAAARGTILNLKCVGEDEKEAFNAVEKLFTEGFGEL